MRPAIAFALLLALMGAAGAIGLTSFVNNTVPAGGLLLDLSSAKLYQNADGTGFLLAR
jgi:hypothetical protein